MSCKLSSEKYWGNALADAEGQLSTAKERVAELESVVRVCKRKIKKGEPWPGDTAGTAEESIPT